LRDQLRLVNQAIQSLEGLWRARATVTKRKRAEQKRQRSSKQLCPLAARLQFRRKMSAAERLIAALSSLNHPGFTESPRVLRRR
jgi:hypothetical protein